MHRVEQAEEGKFDSLSGVNGDFCIREGVKRNRKWADEDLMHMLREYWSAEHNMGDTE